MLTEQHSTPVKEGANSNADVHTLRVMNVMGVTMESSSFDGESNYVLGTMLGNFQKAPVAGKIQFGSGWWFNDQRDGMVNQMSSLANLGALGLFVGMLTDSRSFLSYTRHDYFRRILCDIIGSWIENGEYPDGDFAGKVVSGSCYYNAKKYFSLEDR